MTASKTANSELLTSPQNNSTIASNMTSSKPMTSKLLILPRELRDEIYRHVLVVNHPLYIFEQGPASDKIESFIPDKPAHWLALLSADRRLYAEAGEFLYKCHQFVLVDMAPTQSDLLGNFLRTIGSINAAYLTRISGFNFPVVENPAGEITGKVLEVDLGGVKLLQENCPNLKTLETHVDGENWKDMGRTSSGSSAALEGAHKAFSAVDAEFRVISSGPKIIVKLYRNGVLASEVLEIMGKLGWEISSGR
ncbi:hypothetical protein QBC44DRAFT_143986 [Cladorrhinum sp. PSN332]|nr:hypothetical protein QBC44DRAFT_143986 [Cladorrhinum sp. PSN332]